MALSIKLPGSAVTHIIIPKEKFYKVGDITYKIKRYFVDQIEKVILRAVIAPRTMNISGDTYEEMHVIEVRLKDREAQLWEQLTSVTR